MDNKTYIYESPDGGKTVYRRERDNFTADRELVEEEKEFSWPLMKDCITEQDKEAY